MRFARTRSVVLLATGLIALSACGSDESPDPAAAGTEASSSSSSEGASALEHIHGLGEDPASGKLFVATHFGLFEAAKGEVKLRRAGESRQDTMGFSVVDGKRFIGSGHPDPAAGGPGNLGLIESTDMGRSWKPVSLQGEADFHVLRSSGRTVYGSSAGGVMLSRDGGRSWKTRKPPADVFDLAIDPSMPTTVVASTAGGIFRSDDAGASWRAGAADFAGLLAWPTKGNLTLVDGKGAVSTSVDDGRTFAPTGGTIGATPVAFAAAPDGLLAARADGTVLQSRDAGATWQVRAQP